ncbi:integrase [Terribacillus halophilus]|uniref:Integrase n=1 Tax=Terribacillus halophilus TaxID=361279 RepID=A0A1G6PM80_9BACI|nr:site-specific integrase [Terribacillus halophilus]SDC81071.1 integrase [Terribacillus halophilus]
MKFETEIRNGEYVDPAKSSFEEFKDIWKERHAPKALSPSTQETFYRYLQIHILPHFGSKKISKINTIQITAFLDSKLNEKSQNDPNKTLSPATVKYMYRILKHMFGVAVDWKVIKENPMDGVKPPSLKKKEMGYYSGEDMPVIMEILYEQEIMWKVYFVLAIFAGLRRGENVALQWSHINLEEVEITIQDNLVIGIRDDGTTGIVLKNPKSEASAATISIPKFVTDMLKEYRRHWLIERMLAGDLWPGGIKNTFTMMGLAITSTLQPF